MVSFVNIELAPRDARFQQIRQSGRLGMPGAERIRIKLAGHAALGKASVLVDIVGVDFTASIRVRRLLNSAKAQKGRGGSLVLYKVQQMVRNVLGLPGWASSR